MAPLSSSTACAFQKTLAKVSAPSPPPPCVRNQEDLIRTPAFPGRSPREYFAERGSLSLLKGTRKHILGIAAARRARRRARKSYANFTFLASGATHTHVGFLPSHTSSGATSTSYTILAPPSTASRARFAFCILRRLEKTGAAASPTSPQANDVFYVYVKRMEREGGKWRTMGCERPKI